MAGQPVVIANFRRHLDAELAAQHLTNHGIPFVIRSSEGMLLGPIPPGADLLVHPDQVSRAREVLRDAGVLGDDVA